MLITWAFVTMYPSLLIIIPEPSLSGYALSTSSFWSYNDTETTLSERASYAFSVEPLAVSLSFSVISGPLGSAYFPTSDLSDFFVVASSVGS